MFEWLGARRWEFPHAIIWFSLVEISIRLRPMYWTMFRWLGAWTIFLILFYAWSAAFNVCVPNRSLDGLPTLSTTCRVNGCSREESSELDRGPSARQTMGIWACKSKYPCHSTELSNTTFCFRLPLGSHTGDTQYEFVELSFIFKWIISHEIGPSPKYCTPISCRVDGPAHTIDACPIRSTAHGANGPVPYTRQGIKWIGRI